MDKKKQEYKRRDTQTDILTVDDLHKHFKDLFGSDQEVMTQDDLNENISNDFLDSDITYEELKKAIFSQNNNKSSGIDGLIAVYSLFDFSQHIKCDMRLHNLTLYFGVF